MWHHRRQLSPVLWRRPHHCLPSRWSVLSADGTRDLPWLHKRARSFKDAMSKIWLRLKHSHQFFFLQALWAGGFFNCHLLALATAFCVFLNIQSIKAYFSTSRNTGPKNDRLLRGKLTGPCFPSFFSILYFPSWKQHPWKESPFVIITLSLSVAKNQRGS